MPSTSTVPIAERFLRSLHDLGLHDADVPLLVALSGGCDSVVLLHLLLFADAGARRRPTAAHFDHAMRDGSREDALWVAGLCRAWDVPLVHKRAAYLLRNESDARSARHSFLREAARATGDARILTAHHADDQAETVLFRALRGSGIRGLAGMRPLGRTGIARPLLRFWRDDLRRYARATGLRWREDPGNRQAGPARNTLRNEILPRIERTVAPGARRSLVRLAERADEVEAGLDAALAPIRAAHVRHDGEALLLERRPLRELHPVLATRLIREAVHYLGSSLSASGTRLAMQFITDAPSGRELELSGGVRIATEFDTARFEVATTIPYDIPVRLEAAEAAGEAQLRLGGREFRVLWARCPAGSGPPPAGWETEIRVADLSYPLELRAWNPGDRIRTHTGGRRLKKLFADRRVARSDRSRTPVLVDREGRVLWVAGIARSPRTDPVPGEDALRISVRDD
jgi:tRNA(Ile)-lysidine synthase